MVHFLSQGETVGYTLRSFHSLPHTEALRLAQSGGNHAARVTGRLNAPPSWAGAYRYGSVIYAWEEPQPNSFFQFQSHK